jgi:transposase
VYDADIIGFIDEACREANDNTQRVWSFKKPVKRVAVRVKTHVIGFYAINGKSILSFPERQRATDICDFLNDIRKSNPQGKIAIILDNFKSHHARIVKETAKMLNMCLIFLPPYSPDLNPIEFIWKSIKKQVSKIAPFDQNTLKSVISQSFYQFTNSISYAENWIRKFMPNKFKILCS